LRRSAVATDPACPSCNGARVSRIGRLPDVQVFAGRHVGDALPRSSLYSCLACRLKFRHPVLSARKYLELYDNEQTSLWGDDASDRRDWDLVADYVGRHADSAASVLDFGCYTGGLLSRLGPGFAKFGVEVNAMAREQATRKTSAHIVPSLEQLPPGKQFDVVTAVDVVEHFHNPGQVLQSLLRVTRPGGILIVTTGDADAPLWRIARSRWWYCSYPEHLGFISEAWVRQWLSRSSAAADLVAARQFCYTNLSARRYALQACLAMAYGLSPAAYAVTIAMLKRALGRRPDVQPPGVGLSRDHLFLVIKHVAPTG